MRRACLIPLAAAMLALVSGCEKKSETPAGQAASTNAPAAEAKEGEKSRVSHGTNDEVYVKVEAAERATMGLETAALATASLKPEVKAYGHVLDASGLAGLVAEMTTAEAAARVSDAELTRLKTLVAQNNASERALQTAEAAAVRDRAQLEAARLRLLTGWGSAIAARKDLAELVKSLGALESALVELEVPAGQKLEGDPVNVRLVSLDSTNTVPAQVLGPAPVVDAQMQGRGFRCLVQPNPARLTAGRTLTGFLGFAGQERTGVLVPRAAIVRYNGFAWVYRQHSEEQYERVQVELDTPLESGWFVAEGLKPQDKVVTVGAQLLLSEELNKAGGE
jgi:hypothetical protein